ncbi:hypothetical protein Pcinc_035854 [Petrolisthes cinctipes]|uniref:Uncharacterized protein n=1 Tax=Petrolisthes cinctipes TaxID=88211 RepID=A0AAE1EPR9_PETCI|nr:hypothetical protein Pcinc_035854 [Petrolisthes cinctipes]
MEDRVSLPQRVRFGIEERETRQWGSHRHTEIRTPELSRGQKSDGGLAGWGPSSIDSSRLCAAKLPLCRNLTYLDLGNFASPARTLRYSDQMKGILIADKLAGLAGSAIVVHGSGAQDLWTTFLQGVCFLARGGGSSSLHLERESDCDSMK